MFTRRSSPHFMLLMALLLSGSAISSNGSAADVCVSTPTDLMGALIQASAVDEPYTIRIVQGHYTMSADLDFNFIQPITVEGGYAQNCSSRVVDPANTMISIGANHAFVWTQTSGTPTSEINVEGVTFSDASKGLIFLSGAVHPLSHNGGIVNFKQVRFTRISADDHVNDPIEIGAVNAQLRLENVIIDRVSFDGTCAVSLRSAGGASVRINHLTADLQNANDICITDDHSKSDVTVHNSILWSSTGGHPMFRGGPGTKSIRTFVNDIFEGESFPDPSNIQNQINADPQWVNPAAGDYRLQNTSPAVNSGTAFSPAGEPATGIDARSRVIGSAPDRGAYESPIVDQVEIPVINTNDSGSGSLRSAITAANNSGTSSLIGFHINDANNVPLCPAVIALTSTLPLITGNMAINGYTQSGSSLNTSAFAFNAKLCVIIQPASGTLPSGFTVPSMSAGSLNLRGLAMGGFGQPVRILGGQSSQIIGNQFGGKSQGIDLPGAGLNAIVFGTGASGNILIGGNALGDRNLVGGAASSGIYSNPDAVAGVTTCQIVNNLVGMAPDGIAALPNNIGIDSSGDGCQVIDNRVAANQFSNLRIQGDHNVVQGNIVGFGALGTGFPNNASGILVTGSHNTIGGPGGIVGNTVAQNFAGGVVVSGDSSVGNSLDGNKIYDNGSAFNRMDIDLIPTGGVAGPTPNDAGDSDDGPNDLQNFPVPKSLVYTAPGGSYRPGVVTALLETVPGSYLVGIYFSNTINTNNKRGHAETNITYMPVEVPASGKLSFSTAIAVPNQGISGGISMTATNSAGSTSEVGTALSTDAIFVDGLE